MKGFLPLISRCNVCSVNGLVQFPGFNYLLNGKQFKKNDAAFAG